MSIPNMPLAYLLESGSLVNVCDTQIYLLESGPSIIVWNIFWEGLLMYETITYEIFKNIDCLFFVFFVF